MELIVVLGVCLLLAAVGLSLAAVMAAAAGGGEAAIDRERAATWSAGYGDGDLRVLAGLAAAARTELRADRVEIVVEHPSGTGEGVVVTGCRLADGRLGDRVAPGSGLAGRGLLARRTLVAEPRAGYRAGELAVSIRSRDDVVGVVTATAGATGRFATREVARLETLAAEAGRHLGPRAGDDHRDTA